MVYTVSGKSETEIFLVISSTKLWQFWLNLVHYFLNNFFLQNPIDNFHLSWIISLHYIVKLKMLIAGMLPLNCCTKKLYSLSHLICGLQICHIWIQLITACGDYCKRRCKKYASLIWTKWKSDWERSGPTGSCRYCSCHSSVTSLIAPDQWCIICTPSRAIFPHTILSSSDWLNMPNTFNLLDQYCGHSTKYKHCKHNTCHRETNKYREYSIRHTRHSSIWMVMMCTLSDVISISFCLNLHSIITISFNIYLQ